MPEGEGVGGGGGGRGGGPSHGKRGPKRGGFQGGRGAGQAIASGVRWKSHPRCTNASNPYHECVDYCFQRIGGNRGAAEQDSQSPDTTAATKDTSRVIKEKPSAAFANTAGEDTKDMQSKELEAATSARTAAPILEDIKPMITTVGKQMGKSNQDMRIQTQAAPTSPPEPPPTTIMEDIKPKLLVGATKAFDQEYEKTIAAHMVQTTGVIELEGLEEEVKRQREARELRKRRKNEISYPSNGEDSIEVAEYRLALKLLEYERLGYLTKVENEEDDESLIRYGDIFGLAVVNEYPKFFIQVPQHPHYREASLNRVKREMAENLWDLLMPLIQRGISAVRENKEMEIAAVEQMITQFTEEGFNLKHLQAYINTSRRARANRSFLQDELEKVKSDLEIEEKEINDVLSGKPLPEVIKELEANKAMYQSFINKILSDIDASLVKAVRLLDKEKVIRDTMTTPEHTALLNLKEYLERKLQEANTEAWTLFLA